MADAVQIELEVLARAALKSVEDFSKNAQNQLNSISFSTTVSAINDGFELIGKVAGPVFDILKEGFAVARDEALEAEAASFKLSNALRLTGDSGGNALKGFEDLAKSIQKTTTFTDDAVLAGVGLAKSFQLTNAEAKKVVLVATDLAAATGTDLETAVRKLSQTFSGFVDRDLAKTIPGLKNLSIESLLAGGAIDKIKARVDGTAEALSGTFGGSLARAKNAAKDLGETIGSAFINNDAIKTGLKLLTDALVDLNSELGKNGGALRSLVADGFVLLIQSIPIIVRGLRNVTTNLTALGFAASKAGAVLGAVAAGVASYFEGNKGGGQTIINALNEDLDALDVKFGEALNKQEDLFNALQTSSDKLSSKVAEAAKNANALGNEFDSAGKSSTGFAERFSEKFGPEQIKQFTDQISRLRQGLDSEVQAKVSEIASTPLSGIIKLAITGQQELDKAKSKIDQTVSEIANNKEIPDAFRKQAKALGESAKQGLEQAFSKSNIGLQLATGIVAAVKKGAAGAAEAVAEVAGGVAGAVFGPVIGGFVKELINFMAQGPEAVRKQIQEFVRALPDVFINIAKAAPVIARTFAEEMPRVVQKLAEGMPEVIKALVASGPQFATTLIRSVPQLITAFIKGFIGGLPSIIRGFIEGLIEGAKEFVNAIVDGITGAFDNGLFGGGGGNGGAISESGIPIISDIGNFLGLADGGRIPDLPRYSGDKFPARLNAGEQVLSRDLSNQLEQFLSGNSSQPVQITLNVGQNQLAKVLFDLNRNGFRTA